MARFTSGTTDHDGDGRMGGSRKKGTTMAKATKKTTTRAAKAEAADLDAQAVEMATVPDPQSGGASIMSEKPTKTQVRKARKSALEEQFAAADEKGDVTSEQVRDATLSRTVRGF